MSLSRTVSEIEGDNCNFFPSPVYLTPQLSGFPLEFCNGVGGQKTWMMPIPDCQRSLTVCVFVYTQYRHWTDGQTDGIAITISRSAWYACWRAIINLRDKWRCTSQTTCHSRPSHNADSNEICYLRTLMTYDHTKPHAVTYKKLSWCWQTCATRLEVSHGHQT